MENVSKFKAAIAGAIGALTALWGWLGWLVFGWLLCMIADYITGSMAAAKNGKWASSEARNGIWHKAGMVVVVMVAAGTDLLLAAIINHLPAIQLPFEFGGMVCPIVLVWYVITELGSIIENALEMGAPVPVWLTKLLAIGQHAVDNVGEHILGTEEEQHSKGAGAK
jgi:toxin secretion/phage lysis holin